MNILEDKYSKCEDNYNKKYIKIMIQSVQQWQEFNDKSIIIIII
jgi:hypothetical protein